MRAPAPPYRGEGPHALWHVSEDADIKVFRPHRAKTALSDEPRVWAVDTRRHLPLFWYPRDCPRCTFWAGPRTTDADLRRFLDGRRDRRVHAVETSWVQRIEAARLHLYRMPANTFTRDEAVAGYWVSHATVEPFEIVTIDDLMARHVAAEIPLRRETNLWRLWDQVIASTLEYSGIRLRNAQPRAGSQ